MAKAPQRRRADPRFADTNEARSFAETLPDKFLGCRNDQHSWKAWSVRWMAEGRLYERILRCTRCRSKKKTLVDETGMLVSKGYQYAEGYVADIGRIAGGAKDALRLVTLQRELTKVGYHGEEVED